MDGNSSRSDDVAKAVSLLEAGVEQHDMNEAIAIINHDTLEREKTNPGYSARFGKQLNEELVASGKLPDVLVEFAAENIAYFHSRDPIHSEPSIRKEDLAALVARPDWDRGPKPAERALYSELLKQFDAIDERGIIEKLVVPNHPSLTLKEIQKWAATQRRQGTAGGG